VDQSEVDYTHWGPNDPPSYYQEVPHF